MADRLRRGLLRSGWMLPFAAELAAAATEGAETALPAAGGADPQARARDEGYWSQVAALYDVARDPVPLENGYWGVMARPVQAAYLRHLQQVNHEGAAFARRAFPPRFRAAAELAAAAVGAGADELALTRNATEALQALIGGYNRLRPGDAVLCADLDYDSMITAMRWLRQRRGVEVIELALPEPATHQALVDCYAQALDRHRNLRMMLLTQVSHRTGLVLPVAEIAALASRRGVDVILDAAHGVGQLDFRVGDLGADFVGINFHKWIGAPLGVGGLYIRRGRAGSIDPYMGEPDPQGAVHARVHTGTVNFAAFLALPDALDLHERIGAAYKQARLRHLRDRWVGAALETGAYQMLVPEDPRLQSALGAFRLRGRTSPADNQALAARLHDEFGIQAIHRDGLASGACVRVTPAVFTRTEEVDRLAEALRRIAAKA